ncbi:alpha/beta hydrolase [Nocardioides sp. SOB77]|uniref:Alpha/beta hydrolase n=1 Tax=Nocardioides oceani TaxID=3058369 RepID=A0ABT8FC76_9ACTN|nr:alpha/beta hydrolase [Nocardioides oceani]MDN4172196.1 alpha/beta hydrolase [Nocardioides oceani]
MGRTRRVEVDGSWVTVDVHGDPDGRTVVVVPGVMADAAAWGRVAGALEALGTWDAVAVVNRRGRRPSGPLGEAYSLATEVRDLATVLSGFDDVAAVLGWSYGGLVALHLAEDLAVPHLIAYEPVIAPFGEHALPGLRRAHLAGDVDGVVDVALRQVAGLGEPQVSALRSRPAAWAELTRLGAPLHAETLAIARAGRPPRLGTRAGRVDLVLGETNRDRAPYGATFADVARRVPHASVHQLDGQGHLAHLEAPGDLAALVDRLARAARA